MGRRIDGIARLNFRENAALHVRPPRMVLGNDLHKKHIWSTPHGCFNAAGLAIGVEGGSWLS